jgi:hypothetical protein
LFDEESTMNQRPKPLGTQPLKLPGESTLPKKPGTDNLEVKGAQDVIKGTGKLTLPSVNLDDIEIPGL